MNGASGAESKAVCTEAGRGAESLGQVSGGHVRAPGAAAARNARGLRDGGVQGHEDARPIGKGKGTDLDLRCVWSLSLK